MSAMGEMEKLGATFHDPAGKTVDATTSLAGFGANCVRLRLFVAPDHNRFVVNDLATTVALAKRAKGAHQTLMLDFHYSDTWADPSHQIIPAAWKDHTPEALAQQIEAHTFDSLTALAKAGLLPDLVQIGNEIDNGLLWPVGQLYKEKGKPADWDTLAFLLKAGARGARRATPAGSRIRIIVHTASGGNPARTNTFFEAMKQRDLDYDVVGLSYYPWWHGAIGGLRENVRDVVNRFGKEVMVVETAYPWNEAGPKKSDDAKDDPFAWPRTRDGQAAFLRDVADAVAGAPGGKGIGVLWWHPDSVARPGARVWMNGACALWGPDGGALPAAAVFKTR